MLFPGLALHRKKDDQVQEIICKEGSRPVGVVPVPVRHDTEDIFRRLQVLLLPDFGESLDKLASANMILLQVVYEEGKGRPHMGVLF